MGVVYLKLFARSTLLANSFPSSSLCSSSVKLDSQKWTFANSFQPAFGGSCRRSAWAFGSGGVPSRALGGLNLGGTVAHRQTRGQNSAESLSHTKPKNSEHHHRPTARIIPRPPRLQGCGYAAPLRGYVLDAGCWGAVSRPCRGGGGAQVGEYRL